MQFRIVYIQDETLRDEIFTFSEELPVNYLNSLYEDFVIGCRKNKIQLVVMIPIIDGVLSTECYITKSFRFYKDFDLNMWLMTTFSAYELIFKNDRFVKFKKRKES